MSVDERVTLEHADVVYEGDVDLDCDTLVVKLDEPQRLTVGVTLPLCNTERVPDFVSESVAEVESENVALVVSDTLGVRETEGQWETDGDFVPVAETDTEREVHAVGVSVTVTLNEPDVVPQ